MAYSEASTLRSSLPTATSTASNPDGRKRLRMKPEYTHEELEAAVALLLLAECPVHWERQTQHAILAVLEPSQPSAEYGPPLKRVRKFQVDMSPSDEHIPTPSLTRASSIETAESVLDPTDSRNARNGPITVATPKRFQGSPDIPLDAGSGIPVQSRKRTFEMDHTYATVLAKHCREPVSRLFHSDKAFGPLLLKHGGRATKPGRHASHLAGSVPNQNTSVAKTNPDANTNTNSTSQHRQRKMEGFWQNSDAENGFMPFMQPDPITADAFDAMFPQGKLAHQAEINNAMLVAIQKVHGDLIRTSASNQALYDHVATLKDRVQTLENENTHLKALVDDLGGAKRPVPKLNLAISNLDINEKPSLSTPSTGALSGTTIAFPSRPNTGTGVAFPKNEMSTSAASSFAASTGSSFDTIPTIPSTPGTVPPTPTTPGSRTVLYKKDRHDLTAKLPPANLKLPLIPLTDVEIIVFFFNSSTRPIVAVRLYARGGPNVISQIINEHCVVNPDGYKRNTCSVHCNKAVKTFIRTNGEERKRQMSEFFEKAGDLEATNAIRHDASELNTTCDFPMLGLFKDLIKLPSGAQAGVFTECARWCRDNQVDVQVSQAHLIAEALADGTDPWEKLPLSGPRARSDAAMFDATDDDVGDVEDIMDQGKTPAAAVLGTVAMQEDRSSLTSLSCEDVDASPTKPGKNDKEFVVKTENAGSD